MRLKRVQIFGFKTFAEKTEFNLDGDVIAVVGPNGCGKSNLVDAILWALGESNARHLRAQAGQDVIFSGSAKRRSVGFAEVTLLFDNEDGGLPIDTAQVTVTRRLTRAGEGEYSINRRPCRQRDVYELLADSGLGRSGYSIVGQREIDQALAASAQERRAWVDEAAGVQRYRARKIESLKRLDSAQDHLTRVNDILGELEAQRGPLRDEAEVARRYEAAANALREVETGILIKELADATAAQEEAVERIASAGARLREESARADEIDAAAEQARDTLRTLDQEAEALQARRQEAGMRIERARSAIQLGRERLRSLDDLESTLTAGNGAAAIAEMEAELGREVEAERLTDAALGDLRTALGGADDAAREVAGQLKEAEIELARGREREAVRIRLQAESQLRSTRREEARRELEGAVADLPRLEAAVADANAAVAEASARLKAFEEGMRDAESIARMREGRRDALARQVRDLLAEQAALDGRRRGIEATIQNHEGLTQGSRAVMEAVRRGDLAGSYLPVADAIRAERRLALAIETALGASANDLIVEHESEAQSAIAYLKEGKLGRATFQPVSLMRPLQSSREGEALLRDGQALGWANAMVEAPPWARPVIDSLLGRILVVQDLGSAVALARTKGWSRLVTLEGESIHASGAVTGGLSSKPSYGLVRRKADLAEIEGQFKALLRDIAEQEALIAQLEGERAEAEAERTRGSLEIDTQREELTEAKEFAHTVLSELRAAERAREKLVAEIAHLDQPTEEIEEVDLDALQVRRDQLTRVLASKAADGEQARRRLEESEAWRADAARRRGIAEKRLESAQSDETRRARRLADLGPERLRISQDIDQQSAVSDRATADHSCLTTQIEEARGARERAGADYDALLTEGKLARDTIATVGATNHQAELARARAESKRAAAAERLLEEYGVGEGEALAQAPSVDLPPDAIPLASRLRREIRAMGTVNLGAIEAYERLTARYDELDAQRGDILEGVEQVQASVQELDKLTRDRFLETFARVESAYQVLFQKLFGGGEGKVLLDTPSNILESGIEIEVTLPGKKRQRLELLSGGERALCAVGFLFALLETKPSPLVVLDEVDAPLDGRNVERFAEVLLSFAGATQFIVITHNPTTIEKATVWLGVTMQEPGVSTLVPARLPAVTALVEDERGMTSRGASRLLPSHSGSA